MKENKKKLTTATEMILTKCRYSALHKSHDLSTMQQMFYYIYKQ